MNATFVEWPAPEVVRSFTTVTAGATTPEELETLFEDALVIGDGRDLRALFEEGGVLDGDPRTYVGGARRVLQARDTALLTTATAIHVARRGGDGAWRLAISLLYPNPTDAREDA